VGAAASCGHLEVLKWLRNAGCPWDEGTRAAAALCGHLETLRWALQHGCEWDMMTCIFAAEGGHLDLLKWAREQGCPWNEDRVREAATRHEHVEMLRWLG
jgi:hypothetical protein